MVTGLTGEAKAAKFSQGVTPSASSFHCLWGSATLAHRQTSETIYYLLCSMREKTQNSIWDGELWQNMISIIHHNTKQCPSWRYKYDKGRLVNTVYSLIWEKYELIITDAVIWCACCILCLRTVNKCFLFDLLERMLVCLPYWCVQK